jgi:hypothetical protein
MWIRSVERYFVGRTEHVEVTTSYQTDELEMQFLSEHRWWTLDDERRERAARAGRVR